MAAEQFDQQELRAVHAALNKFERRCSDLGQLLTRTPLSPLNRAEATAMYAALKEDLRAEAKLGTVDAARRACNRSEQCFYEKPIRKALIELRPATNSNPITSRWAAAVWSARSEITYSLSRLEPHLQAP